MKFEINIITIISTIINVALLIAIVMLINKAIKGIKNFINRNRELDRKVDLIFNKLYKDNNDFVD